LDTLSRISKIPNLPPEDEIVRYQLLRILNQAVALWKPSSPVASGEVDLLWTIEQLLHHFISQNGHAQDQALYVQTLEVWNKLLASQSIRPIFKTEKTRNSRESPLLLD